METNNEDSLAQRKSEAMEYRRSIDVPQNGILSRLNGMKKGIRTAIVAALMITPYAKGDMPGGYKREESIDPIEMYTDEQSVQVL